MRPLPQPVRVAGRQVAVEDAGPAPGFPVIVHHGEPRPAICPAVRGLPAGPLRRGRPGLHRRHVRWLPGRDPSLLDDPGRARAEFQARSAEFARLTSSAAWWMDRWADRAGKDAAHIPHATAHFPAMRTTPTSRRTTAAQPSPGCAATYDWQARHQELKMKPMTTPMGGRAIGSERPRLYSFGHSNVALEDFLCLLKSRRIEVVADVRSSPRSRYVPHFDAPRLQGALAQQEIKYVSQRRRSVEMPPSPPHRASAARPRSRGASHQRRRPHPGRR